MLRRAKEAAEAANRAKSEFLTNMSHEIRTPLTAILGYADVISDNTDPQLIRDAAETIKRNGQHLLQLIIDILDLSKIEAARLEPFLTRCNPRQIVDEVASLMRVRMDAKGLRMDVEYPDPLPATIRTDPLRLRQILINLVGNAAKFTETGGVRIVTRLADGGGRTTAHRRDRYRHRHGTGADRHAVPALHPGRRVRPSPRSAEAAWAWPSASGWPRCSAATSRCPAPRAAAARFSLTVATGPLEATPLPDGSQAADPVVDVVRRRSGPARLPAVAGRRWAR